MEAFSIAKPGQLLVALPIAFSVVFGGAWLLRGTTNIGILALALSTSWLAGWFFGRRAALRQDVGAPLAQPGVLGHPDSPGDVNLKT